MQINDFDDFLKALYEAGFSMGGENDEGIFGLSSYFTDRVTWHTGDKDTDPWEWRMRVLEEREDIAYSKLFFKKSGFITKQWYGHFLSLRRKGYHFEEACSAGLMGQMEKRVYEVISGVDAIAVHDLKRQLGITKESAGAFEKALVELQMTMYITTCGRRQKTNLLGESFGWSSTVLCTVERFFGDAFIESALNTPSDEAKAQILAQLETINPSYHPKKVQKFIYG